MSRVKVRKYSTPTLKEIFKTNQGNQVRKNLKSWQAS